MANPTVNPDGTVQVAPPTMSAFAQPAGALPPPAPQPAPQVQSTDPTQNPIYALIQALASAFAPKGITQRKAAINEAVEPPGSLGSQFSK